jgi:excisionase family DNA binding protein
MMDEHDLTDTLIRRFVRELAHQIAPELAKLIKNDTSDTTPWLTTPEAVEYTKLPEGTFRKLAACGKIPSHGGRTKLFYRPEVDQALLDYSGIAEESRRLKRVS